MPGAEADPIWSEPEQESAPGPRNSGAGAAQKSGGSATLVLAISSVELTRACVLCRKKNFVFSRSRSKFFRDLTGQIPLHKPI